MNLANGLTMIRLALAPAVLYSIIAGQSHWLVLALLVAAALTDITDGPVARATGKVTKLGIVLDPIADKLVICAVLVGGALAHPPLLPLWLVLAYLAKESLQMAGGAIMLASGLSTPIGANKFGKAGTVITHAGFYMLLLCAAIGGRFYLTRLGCKAGKWVVLAGLAVGFWALVTYIRTAIAKKPDRNDSAAKNSANGA